MRGCYVGNITMTDVAKVLSIPQKRADVLNSICFDTIAQLQADGEINQIDKAIKRLSGCGDSDKELFYLGLIFGRIIQINATAQDGVEKYVEHHWRELTKAKEKLSEHPEFG